MAGLVQIRDVAVAPLDPRLRAFSIDRPRPGGGDDASGHATWALDVDGWVLGSEQAPVAIEIAPAGLEHDARSRWRLPLGESRPDVAAAHPEAEDGERSGFYRAIGALALPREFDLRLVAVFADGQRAPLATVRGSRAPLPVAEAGALSPLLVVALPGADARPLLEALAADPAVIAVAPSQGEVHVAAFWADVLRALAEPASYLRQLSHARNLRDPQWWLGQAGPAPRRIRDQQLQTWIGTEGVEALARFAREGIDRFYGCLGRETGKPAARHFAEIVPGPAASLVRELYPDAREVVVAPEAAELPASSAPDALLLAARSLAERPQAALAATLGHAGLDAARAGAPAPEAG